MLSALILLILKVDAQEIPRTTLGQFNILDQTNVCGGILLLNKEMISITISDAGLDSELDTVRITTLRSNGARDTSTAYLEFYSSNEEFINIITIDNEIWGGWKYISYENQDNLSIHWREACNSCLCGGNYYSDKNVISNITSRSSKTKVEIFPNPTNEVLNIKYLIESDAEKKILIMNIDGITVKEIRGDENHFNIPLYHLPKGLYFIIIDVNGAWIREKIVIN